MQCSTNKSECVSEFSSSVPGLITQGWTTLTQQLPAGWEGWASSSGALVRRRGIQSADGLLQMVLAYAMSDWSLRQVAMWGTLSGVAAISDVAVLKRLRQSQQWLEMLVSAVLQAQGGADSLPAVSLCLVDATTISYPGSHSSDWRIHLKLNLAHMHPQQLSLTDARTGEGMQHFRLAPGEILLADRAYGHAKSVTEILTHQAACVVRMRWSDLSRYQQQGQPFALIPWLRSTFDKNVTTPQSVELQLTAQEQCFALRLVACPLPPEQAEQARRRVRRKAQKNQVKLTPESLYVAGFVLLVTNLPAQQWSAQHIAQLYRLRWQVELYFKRLKSLCHLDHLRARNPQLACVYLLAKLLVALLLEPLSTLFLNHRCAWHTDLVRPLSLWRLTAGGWAALTALLAWPWLRLFSLPDPLILRRYLCNAPRKRLQQDAFARLFVRSLSVVKVLFP